MSTHAELAKAFELIAALTERVSDLEAVRTTSKTDDTEVQYRVTEVTE